LTTKYSGTVPLASSLFSSPRVLVAGVDKLTPPKMRGESVVGAQLEVVLRMPGMRSPDSTWMRSLASACELFGLATRKASRSGVMK
jgi:hypothetical protein